MIHPHGGKLVNRYAKGRKRDKLEEKAEQLEKIEISKDTVKDLKNIANGRYSPLKGFMDEKNFLKVVRDMTLEDGTVWTVPITLDISESRAEDLKDREEAAITHKGKTLAVIEIDEIYSYDKEETVRNLYGTDDPEHPGVQSYMGKGDYMVGGEVKVLRDGFEKFRKYSLSPADTRVLFRAKGWDTVVGFQTRNAPHRGHEYLQKSALELVDGILIHPKIGAKKEGDYRDEVILDAYESLMDNYYRDQAVMSIFSAKMRYMGPREAVFDAIVRKNHGCTHFIVGRDHAGVGDYYGEFEAQKIFGKIGEIGIEPMFYDYAFYCTTCKDTVSEKVCPHEGDRVTPSGTKIRGMLERGETPPEEMMRPEVAETITGFEQPLVRR